jgi:hypothetical protein
MRPTDTRRFDRTLRIVMWLDAFLSVALVVVCVVAAPVVATVGVPDGLQPGVGLLAIACAVPLAAFGAITAVVIMARMRAGDYLLPSNLRLPLPPGMRPPLRTR